MLIRRREMWWPTTAGWLVLGGAIASGATLAAFNIVAFLSPVQLAHERDGRAARTIVVEGWLGQAELDRAAVVIRQRGYERVVTSGGPTDDWSDTSRWSNYAERAADYLRRHGVDRVPVIAVPAPPSAQERTFLSAVVIRDWAKQTGVGLDAFDLVSAGVHGRRSRAVFRMAFGDGVEIGIESVQPTGDATGRWWKSSAAAKAVVGETLSLVWTTCCFWPPERGSHSERWAPP